MLKTLDRYIAGIFLKNFMMAALALAVLFTFQALLGALFDRTFPASQVIVYHLLGAPQTLVQMMPPAVLVATVLTLSNLARSSELVACYSIGFGLPRISVLILALVFMVSCLMLVLQDRILPPTFKKQTAYYWQVMQKRPDVYLDLKQDRIWYRSRNLIYNLQRFDPRSNAIYGMTVYTFDDQFNLAQVVEAERAEFKDGIWKLMKGTVTLFNRDDPFPMTQSFDDKELQINEGPKDFQEIEKEVDGLRLKELAQYIDRMRSAGADTKSYEVKFHSKISLSFIPLVMCVLGLPFSTRGRREGGAARDLGLCLGLTFFYWLFFSVGLSLGSNGALPPMLAAWLPSVIFAALAAWLLLRRR